MSDLEREKLKLELIKVEAAKAEMVYRIMERKEDIKRLESNIAAQDVKIKELKGELDG